jgi:hypothetical protein
MKTKITMLVALMVMIWASPAMGITLNELPEFRYEIQRFNTSSVQSGSDKWNKWDMTLLVLRIIDWGQTRDVATRIDTDCFPQLPEHLGRNGKNNNYYYKYHDENTILGKHPTLKEVDAYFALTIITDYLICNYANPKFKKVWVNSGLFISSFCIINNYKIGVKLYWGNPQTMPTVIDGSSFN